MRPRMLRKLAAVFLVAFPIGCSTPVTDLSSSLLYLWSDANASVDGVPGGVLIRMSLPHEDPQADPPRCLIVQSSIVVLVNNQPAYLTGNTGSTGGDDPQCVDPAWQGGQGYEQNVEVTLVFQDSSAVKEAIATYSPGTQYSAGSATYSRCDFAACD